MEAILPAKPRNRTSESAISMAVLRICADAPDGEATIRRIKQLVPDYINLTDGDKAQSPTRTNEPMWEQIVRNIVSHKTVPGNIIAEGFVQHRPNWLRITDAGRSHLKHKGY